MLYYNCWGMRQKKRQFIDKRQEEGTKTAKECGVQFGRKPKERLLEFEKRKDCEIIAKFCNKVYKNSLIYTVQCFQTGQNMTNIKEIMVCLAKKVHVID